MRGQLRSTESTVMACCLGKKLPSFPRRVRVMTGRIIKPKVQGELLDYQFSPTRF